MEKTRQGKHVQKNLVRPLPKAFFEKPVLILDSGQSVAESVFLERFRKYVYEMLQKLSTRGDKPSVWIVYPEPTLWARYGAYPVNEYEEYEVRPVRRMKPLDSRGFMATVIQFEEGCFPLRIPAPWRTFNSKSRRAVGVYLNPTEQDLKFVKNCWEDFKRPYNMPEFHIGAPADRKFPAGFTAWTDLVWTFDKEARDNLQEAFEPWFARCLPWWRWWKTEKDHKYEAVAAPNWRSTAVMRHPETAKRWGEALGLSVTEPKNDGTWEDFLLGTDTSFYILASAKEQVPFDAMIALARGATLVAPDVPIFQNLPGKKQLYPAKMSGDRIIWSQTEVEQFLKGKPHGLDGNTEHSSD